MIRLPSNHAAITAPLVASSVRFPGIPIGRSLLDGRLFSLSPVQTDSALLPSTNSLALGGLGSGKSTTAKTRIRREIADHGHQAVVIDSFGEDQTGEWAALTRSLHGRVIEAGSFTLNPCSNLLPPEVREQLVRSLIASVEPGALTPQSTHALQHALTHPKATSLNAVMDALVRPEDGRWPAAKLARWGEGVAIALSRYTEGSLSGLFDGRDARLPETDLPILSFDFSRLDRNSPAIPSLMAAVSCWAEQVWLPQSAAVHRHLILEEAWQILLSPATAELIQRLLKNSRKASLSLDVVMHTLSDLGTGKAQDLAKLCEIAHVGRLGPEEAAAVGTLLGLPAWAIERIPGLDPGQAVWKVGPHYVDIVQTLLTEAEARLTDTSTRRRRAQQLLAAAPDTIEDPAPQEKDQDDAEHDDPPAKHVPDTIEPALPDGAGLEAENRYRELPPGLTDTRHRDALQAAREGRCSEAADLAALGERQDITAYGINSDQAVSWLATRAKIAETSGSLGQAKQLRATVARLGKGIDWLEQPDNVRTEPERRSDPEPATHKAPADIEPVNKKRRTWPYTATIAALTIAVAGVWQNSADDEEKQEKSDRAAPSHKGISAALLNIDGVATKVQAKWSRDGTHVILSVKVAPEEKPRFVRIDAGGQNAQDEPSPLKERQIAMPIHLEVKVPIKGHHQAVQMTIVVGGPQRKKSTRAPGRTIEFRPDRTVVDAKTGKSLKDY